MRNPFDQLAKQIGKGALGPSGDTVAHDEIPPEILHADLRHEPDPARNAERERLGLLGQIAACLCLIEIYSGVPDSGEFRGCLAKHIAFWQQRTRRTRGENQERRKQRQRPQALNKPFLWIISAGVPKTLLTDLKLEAAAGWPAGVYFFGADTLRVGIVVASKLPRERSTLLIRLMAAGPRLPHAIKELIALPPDAHERVVAEPILLSLESSLRKKPERDSDEENFIVAIHKSWEEIRIEGLAEGRTRGLAEGRTRGLAEGRTRGLAEGRAQAQAKAVLTALRLRGIAVSAAARKRILAEKQLPRLERWLEKAIVATSLRDVIVDRAAGRAAKPGRTAAHNGRSGRRPVRASAAR
jgi:hypothetical protein